jgi:dTDP-4-amino-4,6-dideoxygalactose transaminase
LHKDWHWSWLAERRQTSEVCGEVESFDMNSRIYLSPPAVIGDEEAAIVAALRSNWIAPLGPEVDGFEDDLRAQTNVGHALALSSGTAAIHLALVALGVSQGDVVIAPSFTFIGSVSPVSYVGAETWFVDSETRSWNLDPDLLHEALSVARMEGRSVGAVIAVDLFGQCADYARIEEISAAFDVPLIEDAAEALGATYDGRPAGSFGRAGILSFNGNKIITTSGGGALVSDDAGLVERCRHLSSQAREAEIHYEHREIGYNYRISNILAALGRAQLATLDGRVAKRRALFDTYVERLGDLDGLDFMPEATYGRSNRWLTALTIKPERFGATNLDVMEALEADNIEARPVWKPMHLQPVFAGYRIFGSAVSEQIFATGLCLPSGTQMTEDDIDRVVGIVRSVNGDRS